MTTISIGQYTMFVITEQVVAIHVFGRFSNKLVEIFLRTLRSKTISNDTLKNCLQHGTINTLLIFLRIVFS